VANAVGSFWVYELQKEERNDVVYKFFENSKNEEKEPETEHEPKINEGAENFKYTTSNPSSTGVNLGYKRNEENENDNSGSFRNIPDYSGTFQNANYQKDETIIPVTSTDNNNDDDVFDNDSQNDSHNDSHNDLYSEMTDSPQHRRTSQPVRPVNTYFTMTSTSATEGLNHTSLQSSTGDLIDYVIAYNL